MQRFCRRVCRLARKVEGGTKEMRSLELIEELNKTLIDASKRKDIVYNNVGENDKQKSDLEHDILNEYYSLTAKEKREKFDALFKILVERHENKYEFRELEILKELYSLPRNRKCVKYSNKQVKKTKSRNRKSYLLQKSEEKWRTSSDSERSKR